jgi:DNA-binding transcriptional LysR family regulator
MKLQHLRAFAAVVDTGGVGAAARRLHVSQPAVSVALRLLEQELGSPLFERPGRRVTPTARAMAFYTRATDILSRCEGALKEFRAAAEKEPKLRLGVLTTLAGRDVMSLATRLARRESGLKLQISEGDADLLARGLRLGRIDAAWMLVSRNTTGARVLWREPYVALVSRDHRLAGVPRSTISLADLDGERIILRGSCELKSGRLSAAGIKIRIAARTRRDELALKLVAAGVGLAIAPESLAGDDVMALKVADLGLSRSIGLKWRPDLDKTALRAVLDALSSLRS